MSEMRRLGQSLCTDRVLHMGRKEKGASGFGLPERDAL